MDIQRIIILMLIILKTNAIILKNGGYEDVYVLIQENNKESDQLIQRIQVCLPLYEKQQVHVNLLIIILLILFLLYCISKHQFHLTFRFKLQ